MAEAKEKPGRKKKRGQDKWKKKIWYTIYTPEEFEKKEIGLTVSEKPELVKGRNITISVREIANQAKKQHINLNFKVNEVKGNKAYTEVTGYEIKEAYLRRMIRRRASKIQTVQDAVTKDGKKARVKAVTITGLKATRAQQRAIRKIMIENIAGFVKTKDFDKLVSELVFGNFPSRIFSQSKKIIPIKRVEVYKIAII